MALLYVGNLFCGGSIVSISRILTAAHCTEGKYVGLISIRAGSSDKSSGGQVRKVSKIIQHPQHLLDPTKGNDLSILFLTNQLTLSYNVAVIRIDKSDSHLPDGIEVLATGWGQTCESVCGTSETLRAVKVPIVENDRCSKLYGFKVIPSLLCAGIGGKDACQGDSGGWSLSYF